MVKTVRGNEYVMVPVESFSKFVVLIPLTHRESATTAYAIMQSVLAQHGTSAEVLTDRGGEFEGELDATLQRFGFSNARTCPNHPSADGLAERCVQAFKRALRKWIYTYDHIMDWDEFVARIAMSCYRSKQAGTLWMSYYRFYARMPLFPAEIRSQFDKVLPASPPHDATAAQIERHAVHLAAALTTL